MKDAVKRFFDANERWVARVLDEGRKAHALKLAGAAPELARTLVAALEGAMLVARSYGEVSRFEAAASGSWRSSSVASGPESFPPPPPVRPDESARLLSWLLRGPLRVWELLVQRLAVRCSPS